MCSKNNFISIKLGSLNLKIIFNSSDKNNILKIASNFHEYFSDNDSYNLELYLEISYNIICNKSYIISEFEDDFEILKKNDLYLKYSNSKCYAKCCNTKFAFNSLLRILLSTWLAYNNKGLLIHGAGIKFNNKCCCFFGESDAGKSTLANKLCNIADVYSDEVCIIEKENNNWKMFPSPFWGELKIGAKQDSSYLTNLFFLNKKNIFIENKLLNFLKCVLFFSISLKLNKNIIDISCDLISEIPLRSFSFKLDNSDIKLLNDLKNIC